MEQRRRLSAALALVFSLAATALVAGSFATDHWVSARLAQLSLAPLNETNQSASLPTGALSFGLFRGTKVLTVLSPQTSELFVTCNWDLQVCGISSNENSSQREDSIVQMHNDTKGDLTAQGLFSFSLWISVEALSAAAMFWGGIAIIFAAINVFIIPIETVNGLQGLYAWNLLAGACSAASLIVFVSLYWTNITSNVLLEPDDRGRRWKVTGEPELDWSWMLLLASVASFFAAGLCVRIAACRVRFSKRSSRYGKKVDAKTKEMSMLF